MRRLVAAATALVVVAGCGQGVWLSRQDALERSKHERGIASVTRREAKLMTWPELMRADPLQDGRRYAPMAKQKVWLVAVAGDVQLEGEHQRWAMFIYNAVTGDVIGAIPGPSDEAGQAAGEEWPPNWDRFPDSG